MAYDIRPLALLGSQARQFFTQAVAGSLVRLWANTFTVFGKVFGLLDFEHELRRQYLYEQLFASTAGIEWLRRHGYELGLTLDPGNSAVGTVTIPAVPGTDVPDKLPFTRADGATYTTIGPTVAAGNSVTLPIQSDQAGASFNMDAGDVLTLATGAAPYGLSTIGTVDIEGLNGGSDPEDVETFRARVLFRKRNPPQGGSIPDYQEWVGEALASALNVYVDSFANDARAVWVCFTVDDQPFGVPTPGQIAIVQAYLNDPIRRPVTARVFVTGPNAVSTPITITNLYPATDDVLAAIEAEVGALMIDEVQPATPSTPYKLYREEIDAAIKRADGVKHFTLVTPAADTLFSTGGDMPIFDTINYV